MLLLLLAANAPSLSCALSPPSSALLQHKGADLLLSLLTSPNSNSAGTVARPGIPLDAVPSMSSAALQQIWKHGPSKLHNGHKCRLGELASYGRCQLVTGDAFGISPPLDTFFSDTFDTVVGSMRTYGFETQLSRYDLFHGHLFQNHFPNIDAALIGMLFHCAEYPSFFTSTENMRMDDVFWNLGYCQDGSNCSPSVEEWRFRNVLWLGSWKTEEEKDEEALDTMMVQQTLWLLDGQAPEIAELRVDDATIFGPECPNTVYEGYLGNMIADVYNVSGVLGCCGSFTN